MSVAELYRDAKSTFVKTVANAHDAANLRVPASPAWSVKDVLAHVIGIADDVLNGRVEGMGSDAWTEAQVATRRDRSIDELIAEWDAAVEKLPWELMGDIGGVMILQDLMVHLCDVRSALGLPTQVDDAFRRANEFNMERLRRRSEKSSLPALRIDTENESFAIGEGDPELTLKVSAFELFRTVTGRRTVEQARALDWSGEPDAWLDHFHVYPWADEPRTDPV